MSRPVGVTASAIVAILGSLFAMLFAVLLFSSLFIEMPPSQPPIPAGSVIGGAAIFTAFAGMGIWTSIGLFRLRPWARTSILVFAGFVVVISIISLLVTMVLPVPPEFTTGTQQTFRATLAVTFGIPLAIATWWLIQFNTQSTKAAFASPLAELASLRPMSITVIAWVSIFGGVSCLFPLLARMPAFLFGVTFTGWTAAVIYAVFAAVSLYIGKGLLELREEARILAIGWSGFSLVHTGVVTLVPPLRERMLEMQRGLEQNQPTPAPFDPGMMTNGMLAFAIVVSATAIWFLIRTRYAFVQAETP